MLDKFFKKDKGQTSLEILIVMGGLIIIAVVVVTIILASSKSKVTQITDADRQNTEIIDKTLFPPNINSLYCSYSNNQVTYNISVIPSVTKDLAEYCLVVNGVKTDNCVPSNQTQLTFTSSDVGNGNYKVALVSKNINQALSSNSVSFSCKVDFPTGTGTTPPGGITPGVANFDCPEGYVAVPGDPALGTDAYPQGGFCVMKWEAKVDIDGDGKGDTNNSFLNCNPYYALWRTSQSSYTAPIDVWNIDGNSTRKLNYLYYTNQISLGGDKPVFYDIDYNANCSSNQTVCDCNLFNYTPNVDYSIVSSAEGQPLGRVDYASAKKFCEEIGSGYKLINNDEWMTIARNIESQTENWVGGIGTGSLKKGNTCNVNSISNYYLANTYISGTNHYKTGFIDYLGSTHPNNNRANTSPARLVLANGKTDREIWDLSGNMQEWIDTSIMPYSGPSVPGATPGGWFEFDMVTNNGSLFPEQFKPINNIGSAQGAGQIWLNWTLTEMRQIVRGGYAYTTNANCDIFSGIYSLSYIDPNVNFYNKVCRCGGYANSALCQTCGTGVYAGLYQLGYYYPEYSYSIYGFRCVYIP